MERVLGSAVYTSECNTPSTKSTRITGKDVWAQKDLFPAISLQVSRQELKTINSSTFFCRNHPLAFGEIRYHLYDRAALKVAYNIRPGNQSSTQRYLHPWHRSRGEFQKLFADMFTLKKPCKTWKYAKITRSNQTAHQIRKTNSFSSLYMRLTYTHVARNFFKITVRILFGIAYINRFTRRIFPTERKVVL